MKNLEYIEKNFRELSKYTLRMVSYHGKILWSFEDDSKSTRTLTQKEFSYYLQLRLEDNNKRIKSCQKFNKPNLP